MSVRYEAVFEYSEVESQNLRKALCVLANRVSEASMPSVRLLICACTDGSYAKLAELLKLKDNETIALSQDEASMLLSVAGNLAADMTEPDTRRLRTWMGPLIADVHQVERKSDASEHEYGQPRSLVNTPENQSSSRKAAG